MTNIRQPSAIRTADLACACGGLALATALVAGQTSPWVIAAVYASILVRLLSSFYSFPLPSQPVKLFLLASGSGMILLSYGTLIGLEGAGLGILLILVSLKLLETRGSRDFQVLILLGYFLCLCDLFFYQDLGHWLYVGAIGGLLTTALARFHQSGSFVRAGRLAGAMALQALPLIILFYLFFPRLYGGFRLQITPPWQNISGMSDRMEPGSVTSLANDHSLAFRASFPDGNVLGQAELYWRGVVLSRGDGLTWVRDLKSERIAPKERRESDVRQTIIMQPHGGAWLVALDRPISEVPGALLDFGNCLRTQRTLRYYEVYSRGIDSEAKLSEDQLETVLQPPEASDHAFVFSPAIRDLVESWREHPQSPVAGDASMSNRVPPPEEERRIIRKALSFFRNGHFAYSLTPGSYNNKETALDEFLFQRRSGFCEHYAGAFATLMRMAGIPSRVVMGYLGGEFNGNYVEVSQSDAHAWCEVWIKNRGWERVDPTSVIAPDRITESFEGYLATHSAGAGESSHGGSHLASLGRVFDQAHLYWANLTFQWDLHVLNYDEQHQRAFLSQIGFGHWRWNELLVGMGAVLLILLAAIAFWLTRPVGARSDPTVLWFWRFRRKLSKAGFESFPSEGPLTLVERAAERFPDQADRIRKIGKLYVDRRYGTTNPPIEDLARAVRDIRKLG